MRLAWLVVFFGSLMLIACNKEVAYIGSTSPSNNPYLLELDTFDAQAVIYRPDSFVTAGKGSMFAGIQKDPDLGVMKMTPYFRMSLPSTTPPLDNNSYYDSITLTIKPNKTYYGDTNSVFKISVDRLSDEMTNSNGDIFYNTSSFNVYPQSLGTAAVKFRPNAGDSILVKMDDKFGSTLFNLLKTKALNIIDTGLFKVFLKGIRLTSDPSNNVIYSLPVSDSNIQMQIHYHQDVGTPIAKLINFGLSKTTNYCFTNVTADRSNTKLYQLNTQIETPATDILVNDEMTQLRTRLFFPGVGNVQKLANYARILRAILEIKPVASRNSSFYPLPPALNLYTYDIAGVLNGPLLIPGTSTTQNGSLVVDNVFGRDTKYTFDITDYINTQLTATTYTAKQLVIMTPGIQTKLTNLVAGMPVNSAYRTRLILSVILYNNP